MSQIDVEGRALRILKPQREGWSGMFELPAGAGAGSSVGSAAGCD